ncbi:hypothetical protein D3C75_1090510 [compost metagenome]
MQIHFRIRLYILLRNECAGVAAFFKYALNELPFFPAADLIICRAIAPETAVGVDLGQIVPRQPGKKPVIVIRIAKTLHHILRAAVKPIVFSIMHGD